MRRSALLNLKRAKKGVWITIYDLKYSWRVSIGGVQT